MSYKELEKSEDLITYNPARGEDMGYATNSIKSYNELGWLPSTKFQDSIKNI